MQSSKDSKSQTLSTDTVSEKKSSLSVDVPPFVPRGFSSPPNVGSANLQFDTGCHGTMTAHPCQASQWPTSSCMYTQGNLPVGFSVGTSLYENYPYNSFYSDMYYPISPPLQSPPYGSPFAPFMQDASYWKGTDIQKGNVLKRNCGMSTQRSRDGHGHRRTQNPRSSLGLSKGASGSMLGSFDISSGKADDTNLNPHNTLSYCAFDEAMNHVKKQDEHTNENVWNSLFRNKKHSETDSELCHIKNKDSKVSSATAIVHECDSANISDSVCKYLSEENSLCNSSQGKAQLNSSLNKEKASVKSQQNRTTCKYSSRTDRDKENVILKKEMAEENMMLVNDQIEENSRKESNIFSSPAKTKKNPRFKQISSEYKAEEMNMWKVRRPGIVEMKQKNLYTIKADCRKDFDVKALSWPDLIGDSEEKRHSSVEREVGDQCQIVECDENKDRKLKFEHEQNDEAFTFDTISKSSDKLSQPQKCTQGAGKSEHEVKKQLSFAEMVKRKLNEDDASKSHNVNGGSDSALDEKYKSQINFSKDGKIKEERIENSEIAHSKKNLGVPSDTKKFLPYTKMTNEVQDKQGQKRREENHQVQWWTVSDKSNKSEYRLFGEEDRSDESKYKQQTVLTKSRLNRKPSWQKEGTVGNKEFRAEDKQLSIKEKTRTLREEREACVLVNEVTESGNGMQESQSEHKVKDKKEIIVTESEIYKITSSEQNGKDDVQEDEPWTTVESKSLRDKKAINKCKESDRRISAGNKYSSNHSSKVNSIYIESGRKELSNTSARLSSHQPVYKQLGKASDRKSTAIKCSESNKAKNDIVQNSSIVGRVNEEEQWTSCHTKKKTVADNIRNSVAVKAVESKMQNNDPNLTDKHVQDKSENNPDDKKKFKADATSKQDTGFSRTEKSTVNKTELKKQKAKEKKKMLKMREKETKARTKLLMNRSKDTKIVVIRPELLKNFQKQMKSDVGKEIDKKASGPRVKMLDEEYPVLQPLKLKSQTEFAKVKISKEFFHSDSEWENIEEEEEKETQPPVEPKILVQLSSSCASNDTNIPSYSSALKSLATSPVKTNESEREDTEKTAAKSQKCKENCKPDDAEQMESQVTVGRKPKKTDVIQLDLMALLQHNSALKKKQKKKQEVVWGSKVQKMLGRSPGNLLDSSAPKRRRGKEREIPKKKRPSKMKRIIMEERQQKKKERELKKLCEVQTKAEQTTSELKVVEDSSQSEMMTHLVKETSLCVKQPGQSEVHFTRKQELSLAEMQLVQSEELNTVKEDSSLAERQLNQSEVPNTVKEDSSLAVTQPFLLEVKPVENKLLVTSLPQEKSAVEAYPGTVSERVAANPGKEETAIIVAKTLIHSRKFREYCTQTLSCEIDEMVTKLLQELIRFQDRLYNKDPVRARAKKRFTIGLREVLKYLHLKKIKMVILAPDLERIKSKGGLDDMVDRIITCSREQNVPCVFSLGRRLLGRALLKMAPVSCVGLLNYQGAEEHQKKLMELVTEAQEKYRNTLQQLEWKLGGGHRGEGKQVSECSLHSGEGNVSSWTTGEWDSNRADIFKNTEIIGSLESAAKSRGEKENDIKVQCCENGVGSFKGDGTRPISDVNAPFLSVLREGIMSIQLKETENSKVVQCEGDKHNSAVHETLQNSHSRPCFVPQSRETHPVRDNSQQRELQGLYSYCSQNAREPMIHRFLGMDPSVDNVHRTTGAKPKQKIERTKELNKDGVPHFEVI